uniref:Uncharacterized protein n=1 Tax=Anguilla anguilla TaxID=7936 RepID=A0A0E9PZD9_ANGAN
MGITPAKYCEACQIFRGAEVYVTLPTK